MKVKKLEGAAAIRQTLKGKKRRVIHVLKLQSIPYGFFEKEILKYFQQFGTVLRVRVARSKKTGNHKGWAYVAFDDPDVAQIAAESMNGYLMFEKRVRAHVMKPEEIPEHIKKGDRLMDPPRRFGSALKEARLQWKDKPADKVEKLKIKRAKLHEERLNKLRAMGINYELPKKPEAQSSQAAPEGTEQQTSKESEVASKKKRSLDKQDKNLARKAIEQVSLVDDGTIAQGQPSQKKRKSDAKGETKAAELVKESSSVQKGVSPVSGTQNVAKNTPITSSAQAKTPVLHTPKAKTPKSTTPIARRVKQRLTPARIAFQQKQEATSIKEAATPKTKRDEKTPSRQRKQK